MIARSIVRVEIDGTVLPLYEKSSSYTEKDFYDAQIADSTTDKDIYPSDIAATDLLVITSDQVITVKHNGSSTAITIDAGSHHVLHGTNITALTVSNASGSTARVQVWFAG